MDPRLKVIIEVVDRVSRTIASIDRQMRTNLRRLQLTMLAVGATVAGFATLAIKASENQRTAMARLEAHAGRMGPVIAAMVNEIAKQLGRDLGFTQSDIAKLGTFIAEMTGRPPLKMEIEAALVLARVTGMTPEQAAALINRVVSGKATEEDLRLLASLQLDVSKFTDPAAAATEILSNLRDIALEATEKIILLKSAVDTLFAVLGLGADGPMTRLIEKMTEWINKVADYLARHPVLVEAIQNLGIAVVIFTAVLTVAIVTLKLFGLIALIVASPILVIIALLGLAALAVGNLAINWDKAWWNIRVITDAANRDIINSINNVIDHINSFIRWYNSFSILIPTPTGWIRIDTPDIPEIGRLHPTFIGPTGEWPGATMPPVGPAGGIGPVGMPSGNVNITINGNIFGMDDFNRLVQEAVRDARQGGGFGDFG